MSKGWGIGLNSLILISDKYPIVITLSFGFSKVFNHFKSSSLLILFGSVNMSNLLRKYYLC